MATLINGRIYQITSPNTKKIYVGSTTEQLQVRFSKHISDWKRLPHKNVSSKKILEAGEARIELLEEVNVENNTELRKIERKWMEKLCNVVNIKKAYITKEEARLDKNDKQNNIFTYCELCDTWVSGYRRLTYHVDTIKHIRNFVMS